MARTSGDIFADIATGDLNNPNLQFRRGIIGNDVPLSIKASGTYQFPAAISATASFQRATGLPHQTTVLVSANTAVLTQVSQSLVVEPRATVRYPDVNQTDLSLRKMFRVGRIGLEPVLDIFNLFNSSVVTTQIMQLGPTYLRTRGIIDGRMIKVGGSVSF